MLGLASCGGGSDSAGIPSNATPAGQTPTPAPSTPPAVSYETVRDFTSDRSFSALGVRVLGRSMRGFGARLGSVDVQSAAIGFDFVASTRTYRIRYGDEQIEVQTTALPTTAQVAFSRDAYSDSVRAVTRTGFSNGLNYVGYLFWSGPRANSTETEPRERRIIFGSRTLSSDIPTTGSSTFQTDFDLPGLYNLYSLYNAVDSRTLPQSVTVNWATRSVTAEFEVSPDGYGTAGSSFRRIRTVLNGVIGADGRISGTFDQGAGGTMEGALYGPRGAEIGLVLVTGSGSDGVGAGVALGRQ